MGAAARRDPQCGQGRLRVLPARRGRLQRPRGGAARTPAELIAAAAIAGGIVFIVTAQYADARARTRRGTVIRTSGGLPMIAPYFFWVPYVVIALRPGPEIPVPDPVRATGLALSVLGVAFAVWAIVTLGRHYDLVLEVHTDHELVRRGPYAVVRHPVYTGLGLHFVGVCLATGNLLIIAGTVLVTFPALYARARAEEALLREHFGSGYDRYVDEVPMLVPGLRVRGGAE